MKKVIAACVAVIGMTVVSAPPAEANTTSDKLSSGYNVVKDVVTDVVGFVTKNTHKIVMVAVTHPVQTGVVVVAVAATIVAPPLLSVDGEVLATAVVTAAVVETAEVSGSMEAEASKAAEAGAKASEESETTAEKTSTRAPGFEESDVTVERCYVAQKECGKPVSPGERANRAVKATDRKDALNRQCWLVWCKSEGNGKIFLRKNAEVDHKVPLACGGNNSSANLQVLTKAENRSKGGRCLPEE